MVGIVGYGAYIPRYRMKIEDIARVWEVDAPNYTRGLGLYEKSVPAPDQDTITMSVEATRYALKRAGIDPKEIGAVYVGLESHPYAVKPSGTVSAEAIGATGIRRSRALCGGHCRIERRRAPGISSHSGDGEAGILCYGYKCVPV